MKKIAFLIATLGLIHIGFSQNKYSNLWQNVERLELKGLTKTALKNVNTIYNTAVIEANNPQKIKALIYKSKFALILEEEAQLNIINTLKNEALNATSIDKNILNSILGNLYWQYYKNNRYKFYNRTATTTASTADFRTWDLNTLFKEIQQQFKQSLTHTKPLQKTAIITYNAIINTPKLTNTYTPTVFDFLATNALDFYKSEERAITTPMVTFNIDNDRYLQPAKAFSKLKITSKDTLSLAFNALKLYQQLTSFHLKQNNLQALAKIDVERLYFVYKNSNSSSKKELLIQTLTQSQNTYSTHKISGLYAFERAKMYLQNAQAHAITANTKQRFKAKEALTICNAISTKFPNSLGAKKCAALASEILKPAISITAKQIVPTQTQSLFLVNYKAINQLFFKVYKLSENQHKHFNTLKKKSTKQAFIKQLKAVSTFNKKLRDEGDYLNHSTEVIVPKFNNGVYLIVASDQENTLTKGTFGTTILQATNLTLVTNTFNNIKNYQIINRVTGKPIKGAKVEIKNSINSRNHINKTLITNKDGYASVSINTYYSGVTITATTKKERAIFNNNYLYNYYYNTTTHRSKKTSITPFIFTDRAIYRPGQIIHFKTIVVKKEDDSTTVLPNNTVNAVLKDANNNVVNTLHLKLNNFGSAAGQFVLPSTGLTGNFTIIINKGISALNSSFNEAYKTISVEAYKRPKFKTFFKPLTETVRLNDSVSITGVAEAYSGANLTNANVKYNVVRTVKYPNWYYWRLPDYFNTNSKIITTGTTTTNAKGAYTIVFNAKADASIAKANLPIFNYKITADVTDANGETRSTKTTVKVGYHSLIAELTVPKQIYKNTATVNLKIATKNLNGHSVTAAGTLKVYKLKAPKQPLVPRAWQAPDYQDITEKEFKQLFPNTPYKNDENNPKNWQKGLQVVNTTFNTANTNTITLKNINKWLSGNYIAVLETKDKFGQVVKDQQIFELFSNKDTTVADNQLFTINTNKKTYAVNDNVALKIASASKNLFVTLQIEKNNKIVDTQIVQLKNNVRYIEIPVTKKDIGGFAIKYHYANKNTFKSGNILVSVPYKKEPKLTIETGTFRDKLNPGATETWTFKIKNDTKNETSAEVLAAMYDASLDTFKPHNWAFKPKADKPTYNSYNVSRAHNSFKTTYFWFNNYYKNTTPYPQITQPSYKWFGFSLNQQSWKNRQYLTSISKNYNSSNGLNLPPPPIPEKIEVVEDEREFEETVTVSTESDEVEGLNSNTFAMTSKGKLSDLNGVKARKNFNETAFFYPQLRTDKQGNVAFTFTMPEALTTWKLQLLAHTKHLKFNTKVLETVTQKELMVTPNVPRFLREGDTITIATKISNLTSNTLSGNSKLVLTDAISGKNIDIQFNNTNATKQFTVTKNDNTMVSWQIAVPKYSTAITYKIVASTGLFSDGEQDVLPVLSNRMLVTETLPLIATNKKTTTFSLAHLKNYTSTTLKHHKLTLEYTANPIWYAVLALPSIIEHPQESAPQTFARYYANTLAKHITNTNPIIEKVFKQWQSSDALLSNLEKNTDLKALIIQETPWVRDAATEKEQQKRIALLFDLNTLKNNTDKALFKLKDLQHASGGFSWFKGARYANNYITQHILTGFGRLQNSTTNKIDLATKTMLKKAIAYADNQLLKHYKNVTDAAKRKSFNSKTKQRHTNSYNAYLNQNHLNYSVIQYLYMRSFYKDIKMSTPLKTAIKYYTTQCKTYWQSFNLMAKGQIAIYLHRSQQKEKAFAILKSLEENSITSTNLGMYWKNNVAGYRYYQAPIETHALLIEAFSEILDNTNASKKTIINNLKTWLLTNKQTNKWHSTKATTNAIYALLLNSTAINTTTTPKIVVGNTVVSKQQSTTNTQAGSGYFKTDWQGTAITPKLGDVTITKTNNNVSWGALYWQYFEDLDKIKASKTALKLTKKLYVKTITPNGKQLQNITKNTPLRVGDLVTVRLVIQTDRTMDFVHLKDMRPAGLEPTNTLSAYKWQDNLGYYQSTKDAATNFFFDTLKKGIYVFEYDLRITNAGTFSTGITNLQSLYAPEFSSHTKGLKINVK